MDTKYHMKHLVTPQHMIASRLTSPHPSSLSQEHFIDDIAERFDHLKSTPVSIPVSPIHTGCLTTADPGPDEPLDPHRFPYMSLVGSLLWVTLTRTDISTEVSKLCQHSKSPTLSHWRAAIRILRYLVTTKTLSLSYKRDVLTPVVSAYVDTALDNETLSGKSRYGYVVY